MFSKMNKEFVLDVFFFVFSGLKNGSYCIVLSCRIILPATKPFTPLPKSSPFIPSPTHPQPSFRVLKPFDSAIKVLVIVVVLRKVMGGLGGVWGGGSAFEDCMALNWGGVGSAGGLVSG